MYYRNQGRQERSRETIRIIIQAAKLLLIEQGPKAFNTNKIAKRAGVSIGSLYQYFPNKNSICSYFFKNYFQDQIDLWFLRTLNRSNTQATFQELSLRLSTNYSSTV